MVSPHLNRGRKTDVRLDPGPFAKGFGAARKRAYNGYVVLIARAKADGSLREQRHRRPAGDPRWPGRTCED
jgi:hypothetical protein